MDYPEVLRRLALNDSRLVDELYDGGECEPIEPVLDPKILALVRIAALIAVGGSGPSYGAHADAALGAGASVAEIVDVLVGSIPVVGLPRVVAAAPQLGMAVGYNVEDALQQQTGP